MASIMDGERQFHIKTIPEEVGRYCILCGDPGRVPKIAKHLDNPKQVAFNREYNVYTGTLFGEKVTVCSTGIGGPSAAIAVEELIKCGADTFIRVGTSGGMDLSVSGGDLVIANAAVRGEGTSKEYIPIDYPSVANFEVTSALVQSVKGLCNNEIGNKYHVGIVHSKDSFYGEVEANASPMSEDIISRWDSYLKSSCLTSEMECAAIYAVGIAKKVRCGAVLVALWNVERSKAGLPDNVVSDTSKGIKCAVEAIKLLIVQDE
ncbi:MAG: nucleoside phosphorylase [Clostridiales bacterium]|nr:nucleoside phosphorylase [Clostridiales bacterium]